MVTADVAGRFEAPIYAMLAIQDEMAKLDWGKDGPPAIRYHGQPENDAAPTLLWDGEWEVTYVTFRDMGAAFMWRSSASICWSSRNSARSSCRWSS